MPSSIIAKLKPNTTVKVTFGTSNNKDAVDEEPRFVVGYWSIRGLAAPLRMMLCAAKVNHWVAMYDVTESPEGGWNLESWYQDKAWLRDEHNPLMNLPFLIDTKYGDTTIINQTNAIFAYLGRELNMLGSNRLETIKCEELLGEVMDIRNAMTRFVYSSPSPSEPVSVQLASHVAVALGNFEKLEHHLATKYPEPNTDICYLVGDKLSAPDFHLWEMLVQYETLFLTYGFTPFFQTMPHLGKFRRGFAGLRENQFYQNSFLGRELPFNNLSARFGSTAGPRAGAAYVRGQATPWHNRGVMELHCGSADK